MCLPECCMLGSLGRTRFAPSCVSPLRSLLSFLPSSQKCYTPFAKIRPTANMGKLGCPQSKNSACSNGACVPSRSMHVSRAIGGTLHIPLCALSRPASVHAGLRGCRHMLHAHRMQRALVQVSSIMGSKQHGGTGECRGHRQGGPHAGARVAVHRLV
jgi:hypothetical protein